MCLLRVTEYMKIYMKTIMTVEYSSILLSCVLSLWVWFIKGEDIRCCLKTQLNQTSEVIGSSSTLIRSLFVSSNEMLLLDIQCPDPIALVETRLHHVSVGQDHGFTGSCPTVVFSWMAHADMLVTQWESKNPNNVIIFLYCLIIFLCKKMLHHNCYILPAWQFCWGRHSLGWNKTRLRWDPCFSELGAQVRYSRLSWGSSA